MTDARPDHNVPAPESALDRADELLASARHHLTIALVANANGPSTAEQIRLALVELDAARTALRKLADMQVDGSDEPAAPANVEADVQRVIRFLERGLRRDEKYSAAGVVREGRDALDLSASRIRRALRVGIESGRIALAPLPGWERSGGKKTVVLPVRR